MRRGGNRAMSTPICEMMTWAALAVNQRFDRASGAQGGQAEATESILIPCLRGPSPGAAATGARLDELYRGTWSILGVAAICGREMKLSRTSNPHSVNSASASRASFVRPGTFLTCPPLTPLPGRG